MMDKIPCHLFLLFYTGRDYPFFLVKNRQKAYNADDMLKNPHPGRKMYLPGPCLWQTHFDFSS